MSEGVSILRLALRKLKPTPDAEEIDSRDADLDAAISEFENAVTPVEKREAFRAALNLAKTEQQSPSWAGNPSTNFMARTFTLAQLRTRVRERADMENSEFCSDAEINRYISASHAELYDILVNADPERYMREQTITGDGSTKDFAVASDYYGTIGVDYLIDTGQHVELRRAFGREINRFHHTVSSQGLVWHPIYNTTTPTTPMLRILPPPESGTYRHRYTVSPSDLTTDADIVDGVSGWEEYIVLDAAMKCLEKEESPTGALERKKLALVQRIEIMAESRNLAEAGHVIDVRREELFDPAERPFFRRSRW